MKRIIAFLLLTIVLSVFVTGCGKSAGNEFIGKWVNSETSSETMEIKRNGDTFILAQTIPDFFGKAGQMKTSEYPAVFKDSVLTINAGLGPVTVSYVKDGDNLLINGHKYLRQK